MNNFHLKKNRSIYPIGDAYIICTLNCERKCTEQDKDGKNVCANLGVRTRGNLGDTVITGTHTNEMRICILLNKDCPSEVIEEGTRLVNERLR